MNAGIDESLGTLQFFEFTPHALSTFQDAQARHLIESGCTLVRTYQVPVLPLASICREYANLISRLDLLCIDVEGMELRVVRTHDFAKFSPRLVVCELAATLKERTHLQESFLQHHSTMLRTIGHNIVFELQD